MSDLISREDLAKELNAQFAVGDITREIANDILNHVPTAEPERKWIPVSEKLPKVRTDVLLAFEKNMAVGFYSHDCWNVNTGNGFYTGVFTDEDKPIAWMPLPEPWKGE